MAHTLAAVFTVRDMAERARHDLITAGFPAARVRLHDAGSDDIYATENIRRDNSDNSDNSDSLLGNIKHFFADLFGSHADRHIYAEAVRRGHVVLTLEEASDADIERATDLVERYAPLDIDAHAEHWRAGGWQGAPQNDSAMRQGASMQSSAPSQQGTSTGKQNSAEAASQQFAGSMAPPPPPSASANARRYPSADNLPGTSDDDEQYYRKHWSGQYAAGGGHFDDYDPAYRYGHSMAGSDSYRGQSWEQVEVELRSTWEHTYPQSAWGDFKAAIQHGWERVTS